MKKLFLYLLKAFFPAWFLVCPECGTKGMWWIEKLSRFHIFGYRDTKTLDKFTCAECSSEFERQWLECLQKKKCGKDD